ncbi:MAG: PQQ-dependent sugar dehydrogenase, partial [Shimia sp.]
MKLPFALSLTLSTALATVAFAQDAPFPVTGTDGVTLTATPTAEFDAGWAMTLLPDGGLLVTEKAGTLVRVSADGTRMGTISGTPETRDQGQGGLGDVILHPDFANNGVIYLSPVEFSGNRSTAVVYRATLTLADDGGSLSDLEKIWEQSPEGTTTRHYSQKMAFGADGFLYVTSGDRGLQDPSQDLSNNMGTVVRLTEDGAPAPDNPFADQGGVTAEIWSYGHRNPLGLHLASDGTLWSHEMGPRGGDELNIIQRGANYGWPLASNGENYSGSDIPDHTEGDGFTGPLISWVPAISPAGLVIYEGDMFAEWEGDAIMGGLSSQALIRVDIEDGTAREAARYTWDRRIR